jgi:hypothetical protein
MLTVRLRGSTTHSGQVHSSVDDLEGVGLTGGGFSYWVGDGVNDGVGDSVSVG